MHQYFGMKEETSVMLRKPPLSFPSGFPWNCFPPSIISRYLARGDSQLLGCERAIERGKKEESKRRWIGREKEWGREFEGLREDRKIGTNSGSIFDRSLKVRSVYYAWNLILKLRRFAIAKRRKEFTGWKSRGNERERREKKFISIITRIQKT